MSGAKKTYAIMFVALGFILLWAFLSAGFLTTDFARTQVSTQDKQELDVSSMILTETREGQRFWEIYGEKGSYNSNEKIALLTNVIGNFYRDNEVAMSFESSQGTYNEEKNEIILYNRTFIVLKDKTMLKCDRLVWSGSDKDIVALGNVEVNRNDDMVATGDKIIISPDYSHFKLIGNKSESKIFDKNKKNNDKSKGTIFQ